MKKTRKQSNVISMLSGFTGDISTFSWKAQLIPDGKLPAISTF